MKKRERESSRYTYSAGLFFIFILFYFIFFSNNIVAVFSVYIYAQRSTLRNGPQQLSVNWVVDQRERFDDKFAPGRNIKSWPSGGVRMFHEVQGHGATWDG